MDAAPTSSQPQQPSAANQPSSTGPQIRSRITVVCAECKRLKLKCDRRAPCGSCTKRSTVERCIYSPAAAEKVDLHSLNNRLIQVEATLALVTSGQTPPAFQSTYPLAHLANTSSPSLSQGSHEHHHHYAAPTLRNACISLSHQELSLWFEELDLGISLPSSSSSCASSLRQHNVPLAGPFGYIKLEPSPFEIELTHPRSTTVNSITIDTDESQTLSGNTPKPPLTSPTSSPNAYLAHQQFQSPSQLQKQQRYSAQLLLPALSIYYPVPSITLPGSSPLPVSTFPSSSTIRTSPPTPPPSASASSSPYAFPQPPQYSKPQITPALVALLPPLPTCKQFLNCAKEIFRVRPVPFEPGNGWVGFENRCISLLSGGYLGKKERERDKAKEREERAREAKRARQIYFAGISNLQSVQQRNDILDDSSGGVTNNSGSGGSRILDEAGVAGEEFSLPFFSVMCAVLAVGSHSSSSSQGSRPSENPAFFFALSQQALGVWDTHASSSGMAEERDRMDFLLASLINVVYLLLSGSSVSAVGEDEGVNLVYPLVGKIVNAARGMGLGRDGSGQQLKTSDGDASASSSRARGGYQTNKEKEAKLWEDWKLLMWWDIMFYDLFIADSLGHQPYMSSYTYTPKLPECASDIVMPAIQADSDNDGFDTEDEEMEPHRHDGMAMQQDNLDKNRYLPSIHNGINGVIAADEEAYFGARCRLTQLGQTIKHRMAYPECCCGYTLDQAVSLENEIRRWQCALAASIKPSSVSSGENALRHPPLPCGGDLSGHQDKPAASLISQIHSCELSLMANLLMLRVHAPFLRAPSPAPPTSLPQHTKAGSSVSQLNAHAAESTVKAAQSIIRTARSLHAALGSHMSLSITPSMLDFYSLEKMVLDSVVICANPGLSTKLFPSSSTWMFDTNALLEDVASGLNLLSELRVMKEPHRKIVDALGTKLSQQGTNLLKRKHDQVDMTFEDLSSGGVGDDATLSGFDGSQYGNSVTQQQQSKAIDLSAAFPSPVSSAPMSSGGIEQPPHAQKHKKSDSGDLITTVTNAASARLAAAATERDKQKEKDKTGKTTKKPYPPVGIRVRVAKDGSIIRPQRTATEGQMQDPPPRSNPDAVLAFQQQQKQKL